MASTSGHLVIGELGIRDIGFGAADRTRCAGAEMMNRAKLAIVASRPRLRGCLLRRVHDGHGPIADLRRRLDERLRSDPAYYGQPYEYRDPYGYPRPYGPPGMGSAHTGMRHSRGSSPRSWRVVHRRKAVCYKWHKGSGEWRPDRSDTKDNFGEALPGGSSNSPS